LSNNPILLAIFTLILWSFGSLLSRLVAIQSQFVLLSISFLFSFLTLLLYLINSKQFSVSYFRKIPIGYLIIGPLGYFVYSVAITQSSRAFQGISETTILNNTWPIFTVLFSELVFNKSIKPKMTRFFEGVGIIFGLLSIIALVTKGDLSAIKLDPLGILWGLLAGFSYGLFGAYSGTIEKEQQKVFLFVSISISLLLLSIPAALEIGKINGLTFKDIFIAFAMGCLLDELGYILWTRAIWLSKESKIRISKVASMMFFLPFTNLLIVRIFFQEDQLSQPFFIASLIMILISTFIIQKASDLSNYFGAKQ
jgi:drug/metabolite transporter (DMT)-like permease